MYYLFNCSSAKWFLSFNFNNKDCHKKYFEPNSYCWLYESKYVIHEHFDILYQILCTKFLKFSYCLFSYSYFSFILILWRLVVEVLVVRTDSGDPMSQDEVTSLTLCVFLPTLFNYKSSLLLKEFTECTVAMSLGKLFHGVVILLRRKCVLGSLPEVRSRESWNACLRPVLFCSGLSILFSSHQFTFSRPCTIL